MAETAPNKTVSSAGMRPAVVTPNLASTPTHRVKKLLETYHLAAGSMLGPPSTATASELSYSKFYPAYHHQVKIDKIYILLLVFPFIKSTYHLLCKT